MTLLGSLCIYVLRQDLCVTRAWLEVLIETIFLPCLLGCQVFRPTSPCLAGRSWAIKVSARDVNSLEPQQPMSEIFWYSEAVGYGAAEQLLLKAGNSIQHYLCFHRASGTFLPSPKKVF